MRIAPVVSLADAVAALEPGERWLAEPSGERVDGVGLAAGTAVTGAVGPSSGFSDDERKLLSERGFRAIRLAGSRLRTETAALALASHWAARRA